jgi:hypothetical protein
MADYTSLQAAIDAGTENMTTLRLNNRNDDGTTSYQTGIDWFFFNRSPVTTIYSSGNSFFGFGVSSEQLRVNRRDCAVWSEYMETGTIGKNRFLKFRWVGTSNWSSSYQNDPNYQQHFDVFLIDNGQIFLNFYEVPVSDCTGTNSLTCGSESVSFTVTADKPCEYTFTPNDPATGTGWSVSAERPNLVINRKPSGSAELSTTAIQTVGIAASTRIIWAAEVPEETTLTVLTKLSGGQYAECTNGGEIAGIAPSSDLSDDTLHIRVDMATQNPANTPVLSQMRVELLGAEDSKVLVLHFAPGNQTSVQNAAEPITVAYNGTTMMGDGGFVQAFELECPIDGLEYKGGQNDAEHIEIASIQAHGKLTRLYYSDYSTDAGHLELGNITATGVLIHVNDI